MRKVYVIYDDSRKPNWDIRNITGKKGFGDTIFKRITLKDRMKDYFLKLDIVSGFDDVKHVDLERIDTDTPVILIYSDFVIKDEEQIRILVNKAIYAHENYKVTQNNKIVCVIFNSVDSYQASKCSEYEDYSEIKVDSFYDISDVNNFRQFITSGFEARFFNSLSGDEYTVVKTSDNIAKLKAEYLFYDFLPDNMKQWFVRPFNYVEDENKASYSMQRYHMTDLAIRYVHGAISIEEFEDILNKLFYFVSIRQTKEVSKEEYENLSDKLYIGKVRERIQALKEMPGYEPIAKLIAAQTRFNDIDEIIKEYIDLFSTINSGKNFKHLFVVGHGDMCFSNILYSKEASLLLLIDPKGALNADDIYTNPYYDLAKLSHSVCGGYDYFNSDLFEITVDEKLKAHLSLEANNGEYVELFKNKLSEYDIDYKLVRLYEASLFLSMLPLHMDRPKKVFAFILNAIDIMDSLKESK